MKVAGAKADVEGVLECDTAARIDHDCPIESTFIGVNKSLLE